MSENCMFYVYSLRKESKSRYITLHDNIFEFVNFLIQKNISSDLFMIIRKATKKKGKAICSLVY
jgi:hypothetical protein